MGPLPEQIRCNRIQVSDDMKQSGAPVYKELRKFSSEIGFPSLDPKDRPGARAAALKKAAETGADPDLGASGTELTSKDFRAAQAKYDWGRAN